MKNFFLFITSFMLFTWGCSQGDFENQAYISGMLTYPDSVSVSDSTRYSVSILRPDSARVDTLFHSYLDRQGRFEGAVSFKKKGQYPLIIHKNNQDVGRAGVILADQDTLKIKGDLARLESSFTVTSREHEAMESYRRLNKNFQRVMQVVRAGQIRGDSLRQEMDKWSNLYWQVYQEESGTLASELAASESIRLLEGWNNQKMMQRIRQVQENDALAGLAAVYGKNYLAKSQGLEATLSYLDTLSRQTQQKEMNMRIKMERIKLLYDSARTKDARAAVNEFQERYSENSSAKNWAKTISYDINFLSPGDSIPDFSFSQNGKTISRDSLQGTPYILEVTKLANKLYQDQFDRTVIIHGLYKNYGLDVVTLPLDESQVTVDAFFDERVKPWPVADAATFDRQDLLNKFNIQLVPTRFLVNKEGKIIRKYVGREYDEVIKGIQTIIKQDKKPAS